MAIGAKQCFARLAKMLHMHGVADAIARAAEPDAETLTGTLQEEMIIGVLVIGLDQVVIDVLDRNLCPGPRQAHCFQFQHYQSSRGILGETLVNADANHFSGSHGSLKEMSL